MKSYDDDNRQVFIFLMILAVTCAFGFQGWRNVLNNFAVENVGINGRQNGILQGMREIPGFLTFLVIYLLLVIREHRLITVALALMGLGVGLTGYLPSFYGLIFTTILMSFGFHYYETTSQSMVLQHFSSKQVPVVMARFRSYSALTNLGVGAFVFGLSYILEYPTITGIIGGLVVAVAVGSMFRCPIPKEGSPQTKHVVLRTRYWLFYALTFMAGARRQIFVAFAVFLLVEKFAFSIQEIVALFFFNNLINFMLAPLVGKAINRFGERAVLSVEYSMLILVFLTYAFADSKLIVAAAYVADHIFFGCSIAIPSFFRKIADPREVASSISMGFTINHIVAVLVPIAGGLVWMVNYKIPFIGGAVFAAVSLTLAQFVRTKGERKLGDSPAH